MAYKRLAFREEPREKVLRGADELADAVRVTLGPKSKSVLIKKKWGTPIVYSSRNLDEALINRAWKSARAVPDFDPDEWRQDQCGAWIRRDQYNHPASEFGWRILDIVADHPGEPDTLRAFHARNTFDVAQDRPVCRVRADRKGLAARSTAADPHNIAFGG